MNPIFIRLTLFLFIWIVFPSSGRGQKQYNTFASASFEHGYIVIYEVPMLVTQAVNAIRLQLGNTTTQSLNWHKRFGYPEISADALFLDLGNPDELGYLFGLKTGISFKLIQTSFFTWRAGFNPGISYVTKKFDRLYNTRNILLGSHLNAILNISTEIAIPLNKHSSFTLGYSIFHFSNGNTRMPNVGINTSQAYTGLRYYFDSNLHIASNRESKDIARKMRTAVTLWGGKQQQVNGVFGKNYPVGLLMLETSRIIAQKYAIGGGFELIVEPGSDMDILFKPTHPPLLTSVGIFTAQNFIFSKWWFFVDTGIYLTDYHGHRVYNKFGFKYHFSPHIYAALSHHSDIFFKGRFIGWGIGFYL